MVANILWSLFWVADKELNFSDYIGETILITTYVENCIDSN